MIIIERHYDMENSSGGRNLHHCDRKVFKDDDIEGIQKFLDERCPIDGYHWFNLDFNYTIL